jgi:hypothetical protein
VSHEIVLALWDGLRTGLWVYGLCTILEDARAAYVARRAQKMAKRGPMAQRMK